MRRQARVVALDSGAALATVGARGSVEGSPVEAVAVEEGEGGLVLGGAETGEIWTHWKHVRADTDHFLNS